MSWGLQLRRLGGNMSMGGDEKKERKGGRYPPCPFIDDFRTFIEEKFGIEVVLGTHPIPQHYYETHQALGTWESPAWRERIRWTLTDVTMRRSYD